MFYFLILFSLSGTTCFSLNGVSSNSPYLILLNNPCRFFTLHVFCSCQSFVEGEVGREKEIFAFTVLCL